MSSSPTDSLPNDRSDDPHDNITVLIVDDNVDARSTLGLLLEDEGYTLTFATTGLMALELATTVLPDLILLDVRLPDIDGIEVCRRLRAHPQSSEVPIILITSYADRTVRMQGLSAGADDFLSKDFDSLELVARVRTITRLNRYRRLLAARETMAQVFDHLPLGLVLVSLDGTITLINPAMLKLFRLEQQTHVLGQPLQTFLDSTTAEQMLAWGRTAMTNTTVTHAAAPVTRPDGSSFPAEIVVAPLRLKAQPLIQLIVQDVTERQQAEAALANERSLLRTLIDNLPDPIYVKDTEHRFVLTNRALAQLVHLPSADDLIGKTDDDFFPPALAAQYMADEQAIFRSGQALINHEEQLVDEAGSERWVITTKVPLHDQGGRIMGLVGIGHDITKRKQLEAQLLHSQKMESIGRLAGGVAHDFNNLLTAISGYAELALSSLASDAPERSDLTEIHHAAQRAAGLTRRLLSFARKQILEPRLLNLNDLILDMDKLLHRVLGEDIDLITHPAPELGLVQADAQQLEQVLLNLAINARDAMPHGGKLTIETANVELDEAYTQTHPTIAEGSYVLLAVSDTGIGMDEGVKRHLFEPFFTTKPAGRGSGLGLATCYGIIQQHGGYIWVYSEVGRGTSFKIYLPRVTGTAEPIRSHATMAPLPSGTETVLVAEDDGAVRALMVRVLSELGYTVLETASGEEALEIAQARPELPLALLLTDVVLPQLSGPALAARLTQLHPGLKVLFISGYTDNAIVHHGRLDVGVNFLQKPFSPAALAHMVRNVLDT